MLVDRGLGVALVPDAAMPWWSGLRVARLALPAASGSRRLGLVWQSGSVRARQIQGLVDVARRVTARP